MKKILLILCLLLPLHSEEFKTKLDYVNGLMRSSSSTKNYHLIGIILTNVKLASYYIYDKKTTKLLNKFTIKYDISNELTIKIHKATLSLMVENTDPAKFNATTYYSIFADIAAKETKNSK